MRDDHIQDIWDEQEVLGLRSDVQERDETIAALRRELAGSREAVDRMHEAWRHDIRALAAERAEAGRLRERETNIRESAKLALYILNNTFGHMAKEAHDKLNAALATPARTGVHGEFLNEKWDGPICPVCNRPKSEPGCIGATPGRERGGGAVSEAESPFDVLPEIHDKFGRLHRFEKEYLEELGPQGDLLSHRDLAMINAGFRRGFAAGRTPGPATAQEVHQQLDFREGGATVSEAKKAAKQFEDRINNAAYNEEDTDGIDATIVDEIRSELRGSRAYIVAHVFLAGFAAGQSSHSENEPKRGS